MALILPGGILLPTFWILYAALGALGAALAVLWFGVPNARWRCRLEAAFPLFILAQIGMLAVAVRREGMEFAAGLRAAHVPGVPLYTIVLAPLGLALLALVLVSVAARHLVRRNGGPDEIVVDGQKLDMPLEARRLYATRESLQTDLAFAVGVGFLTMLALDLDIYRSGWAMPTLAFVIWVFPALLKRAYRSRLAPYEFASADPEILRHARELAERLGVAVDAAVVDQGPHGHARVFLTLQGGVLTVSQKLIETTDLAEREFLLLRAAEYEADAAGRAVARGWYTAAVACLVSPFLVLLPAVKFDIAPLIVIAGVGVAVLPLVGLWLWLGVARRLAVGAWTRAGNRTLAATRKLHPALSAVRKCGNQGDDPQAVNSIIFNPLPTVRQQIRDLNREAVRLGLRPPDAPPKGMPADDIPMEPW
jgi:hypothetical protein